MKKIFIYLLYIYAFLLFNLTLTLLNLVFVYGIETTGSFERWNTFSKYLFVLLEAVTVVFGISIFKNFKSFYGIRKD